MNFLHHNWGNLASAGGLIVSVWTLYYVTTVRRAVSLAVTKTLANVVQQLLRSELDSALEVVRRLRDACLHRHWPVALERCHEAISRMSALADAPSFSKQDRLELPIVLRDLRILKDELRRGEAHRTGAMEVSAKSISALDDAISWLSGAVARHHRNVLEQAREQHT